MEEYFEILYCEEISAMMFGFGDNQNPNPETVRLVQNIVLKQIRDILQEASKNADRRKSKQVQVDDLIFLLRHDRHKMQRFVKYIHYKYVNLSTLNYNNHKDNDGSKKKKYDMLKSIIENIDETGEMLDLTEVDNIKNERVLRAERISLSLDEEKYKEYVKARQVTFNSNHFTKKKKFREFIDPQFEINITQPALEILELMAYGIVGHLVDMALIIRQNSKRMSHDPLNMLTGSFYNPSMFNAPHLSDKQIAIGQPPITVREIREVLRRCYMPQVGYMKFSHNSVAKKRKIMY